MINIQINDDTVRAMIAQQTEAGDSGPVNVTVNVPFDDHLVRVVITLDPAPDAE